MDKFINEKIAIKCETKEEFDDLIKRCKDRGLKDNFPIRIYADYKSKGRTIAFYNYFLKTNNNTHLENDGLIMTTFDDNDKIHDWKIITYKEYFKDEERIVITRRGNEVIAFKSCGEFGIAKCHLEDIFDFEIGAKLALERLFEKKQKFKPYLNLFSNNVGFIGEKANFTALFDEELYVGDVVEVYNTNSQKNFGQDVVCKDNDKYFVMGIKKLNFKVGVSGCFQIRKVRPYTDLKHNEVIDNVKVILKEEKKYKNLMKN